MHVTISEQLFARQEGLMPEIIISAYGSFLKILICTSHSLLKVNGIKNGPKMIFSPNQSLSPTDFASSSSPFLLLWPLHHPVGLWQYCGESPNWSPSLQPCSSQIHYLPQPPESSIESAYLSRHSLPPTGSSPRWLTSVLSPAMWRSPTPVIVCHSLIGTLCSSNTQPPIVPQGQAGLAASAEGWPWLDTATRHITSKSTW